MQTWCLPFSLAYKNNLTSLSLWVLLSELPRLSLPALPSLLTLPTYILNQVSTSFITSLHLHHFLFLFSSSALRLSLLRFKLLICFGCLKWIAHRWPNFSVDFPKLISCCILVWIPNEYCVKIGKSLIRWNGGGAFPSSSDWISLIHPPILCRAICYGWIFIVLLMQVKTKFLIWHTCLCSILEHQGLLGVTNANMNISVMGTQSYEQTHTHIQQPYTYTRQHVANNVCVWLYTSHTHFDKCTF